MTYPEAESKQLRLWQCCSELCAQLCWVSGGLKTWEWVLSLLSLPCCTE